MPTRPHAPLTLPEYERLFRTIHAIVANEKGDPSKACIFFAIAGAHLLRIHHRLRSARPVAGLAGYNLDTQPNLGMVLGSVKDGVLFSSEDAFHSWIDVDGYIIDLTAPLFNDMAAGQRGAVIQPRMFQKPASPVAEKFPDLEMLGAYVHVPNPELTNALVKDFASKQTHLDLITICAQWYVRPPKRMKPSTSIANQHGMITQVQLSSIRVAASW